MQILFSLVGSKGIGLVQVCQNLDGILRSTEVGKHPVKCILHVQGLHLYLVSVEGHQIGFHAKGTSLVETSATAGGTQLAEIGDIHLA